MLSPLLVGPILREKSLDAQCIPNTTRVCLKALEKHFFLLWAPQPTPPPRYGVTKERAPPPAGGRAETTSAGGNLLPCSPLTADCYPSRPPPAGQRRATTAGGTRGPSEGLHEGPALGRGGWGKGATPQPMAGPRGRDRHAAPPLAVRRRRQGTRGPPHSPPPLPLRPKSGRRQTKQAAAPHPPRRGRYTRGAGAPRPRQAPARPARCRPTADRRRPGRRKRSGPIRGRPGEDGGANQGGGVPPPPPPPPPPAAPTRWRLTRPRPTRAAAQQPPRHEYTPGGHARDNRWQADARRGAGAGGRPPHPPPCSPPRSLGATVATLRPPRAEGAPPFPQKGPRRGGGGAAGPAHRAPQRPHPPSPVGVPAAGRAHASVPEQRADQAWRRRTAAHQNSMEAAPHMTFS